MTDELKYPENLNSRWVKCIAMNGNLRAVAVQGTDIVKFGVNLHQFLSKETAPKNIAQAQCFGEALLASVLLSTYCKDGERINLNIQSSGPLKQVIFDASPDGKLRGYAIPRSADSSIDSFLDDSAQDIHLEIGGQPVSLNPSKSSKSAGRWGSGILSVLRAKNEENSQPYIGSVPLVTGHLAKDLTFYWSQSEQVATAVGIFVDVNELGVQSAGAFLVQAMPGAKEQELQLIEKRVSELYDLARLVSKEKDPIELIARLFEDTQFMVLEKKRLEYRCQCSWKRVLDAVVLVGATEIQSMLEEDRAAHIRCDFCTRDYSISEEQLMGLLSRARGDSY